MKLSMSEPCFPYSGEIHKPKQKSFEYKKIDLVIFTAPASTIQKPHRKRKNQRKIKKHKSIPKFLKIREKTFLTNDLPKAKRRKIVDLETENNPNSENSIENIFDEHSREELKQKKKKFIEILKNRSGKVCKWYLANDFHMKFMEEFAKSLEEDLKNFRNISRGKKKQKKSYVKEYKREKLKEMKDRMVVNKSLEERSVQSSSEVNSKKKFEYFEIKLDDDFKGDEETETSSKVIQSFTSPKSDPNRSKGTVEFQSKDNKLKKFECFEVANEYIRKAECEKITQEKSKIEMFNEAHIFHKTIFAPNTTADDVSKKKNQVVSANQFRTSTPKNTLNEVERFNSASPIFKCGVQHSGTEIDKNDLHFYSNEVEIKKNRPHKIDSIVNLEPTTVDSFNVCSNQNSSLENIEEVDEDEEKSTEERKGSRGSDIEIEDFILSKPNTQKLLLKKENCLDQLFPKTRKISETITSGDSATAVQLGYTANSVYDLKSNEEKNISERINSRILKKRLKKGSHLPQIQMIKVKNEEKKENSMLSLIELWKSKRGNLEGEKAYKLKTTLVNGKLASLSNKNSFQM